MNPVTLAYQPATYLKVSEVALALRCSAPSVYRLIGSGQLAAVRVGAHLRVPGWALTKFEDEARA